MKITILPSLFRLLFAFKNSFFKTLLLMSIIFMTSCDKEVVQTDQNQVSERLDINDGLIYYFPFSGNSIDQVTNQKYDTHGAKFERDRKGKQNSSLCLNNNWMDLAAGLDDDIGTISFWIKLNDLNVNIFTTSTKSLVQGTYNISVFDGKLTSRCENKYGYQELDFVDQKLEKNKWYHIVLRWDDNIRKVETFINGKLALSTDYIGDDTEFMVFDYPLMGKSIQCGDHDCGDIFYNFNIDEIRRYNRRLSDNDIEDLYNF